MKKSWIFYLKIYIICISVLLTAGVVYFAFFAKSGVTKNSDPDVVPAYELSKNRVLNDKVSEFDLFFLKKNNEAKNKVYSPLSIKYALGMLSAGAKGETKAQIDSVLGDYKFTKYQNSKNLSLANAFFLKEDFKEKVNADYIEKLKNNYAAEIIFDPFANAQPMNSWVNKKTFKLIDKLVDDKKVQEPRTKFIAINALAIDMEWKQSIHPYLNEKETRVNQLPNFYREMLDTKVYYGVEPHFEQLSPFKFNNKDIKTRVYKVSGVVNKYDIFKELGKDKIIKTLNENDISGEEVENYLKDLKTNYGKYGTSTDFLFFRDDSVNMVAKDLKEYNGTALQYVAIMPRQEKLAEFIEKNDANKINDLVSKLKEVKPENFKEGVATIVIGEIPGFDFEYELNLPKTLKALGVTDIFDKDKANLKGISSEKLYVTDAKHKANIFFCNRGIKAAAATAEYGGMGGGGFVFPVPTEVIDITFDKPFLFLIRDKKTGESWFLGTVYQPANK